MDGTCKCFDANAEGYVRSEAVCVVFLQKAKNSRRIYAKVVHAKTNCDGYKEQGITYPSGPMQQQLMAEFYKETKVDPLKVSFIEAHGTGTKVGDPEEVHSLDKVFCNGRSSPLLIGSVKANIGHTEPVSGLCSISKVGDPSPNPPFCPNPRSTRRCYSRWKKAQSLQISTTKPRGRAQLPSRKEG